MKIVTVAKFELSFTRCRNSLNTVRNLTVKRLMEDVDAKEMYLHPVNRSVSFQKRCEIFCFHHLCLSDAVSKICRLEFRFQNLLFFQILPAKNVPSSYE